MITLKVEDYCHNCPNFEPDALIEEISCTYKSTPICSTEIFCKKRESCVYQFMKPLKKETNK